MKLGTLCGAALAIVTLATVSYAAKNSIVGGQEMFPDKNIQNAVNSADHTTLVAAVKASGLTPRPRAAS